MRAFFGAGAPNISRTELLHCVFFRHSCMTVSVHNVQHIVLHNVQTGLSGGAPGLRPKLAETLFRRKGGSGWVAWEGWDAEQFPLSCHVLHHEKHRVIVKEERISMDMAWRMQPCIDMEATTYANLQRKHATNKARAHMHTCTCTCTSSISHSHSHLCGAFCSFSHPHQLACADVNSVTSHCSSHMDHIDTHTHTYTHTHESPITCGMNTLTVMPCLLSSLSMSSRLRVRLCHIIPLSLILITQHVHAQGRHGRGHIHHDEAPHITCHHIPCHCLVG